MTEPLLTQSSSHNYAWEQSKHGLTSEEIVRAAHLAKRFHETYEELALALGYETRKESAVPWESVPDENRRLMVATLRHLIREGSIR